MTQEAKQLELVVIASGSKGNAAVVRDRATGRAVLVDCGACKRDFFAGCDAFGVDPAQIEAVLITHEHTDHTKGLGVVMRGLAKLDLHPPVYASRAVRRASSPLAEIEPLAEQRAFAAGDALTLAGMQVHAFATSHDSVESYGFRFEAGDAGGDALGYMTDTGIVTGAAHEALEGVRLLAIEGNHDEKMLAEGLYPWHLKQRIAGEGGHLSNAQCAAEVRTLLHDGLEHIAVMHISENNNTYGIPVRELQTMLEREGHPAIVQAAFQKRPISLS